MGVNRFARFGAVSRWGRFGIVSWPVVVGALVLASCGSEAASGATESTINLDATNYIVKDPVTTTVAPLPSEGDTATGTQTYEVQSGDYAIKVADQFGVPLQDLLNINGWATGNEFPFPGTEIIIPPGGTVQAAAPDPGAVATDGATTDAGTDATTDTATPVGETIPDSGSNCEPGSYEIVEGDYLGKVAAKFDVTVEALDAANSGTDGYSAFYPGLKIVIPAKSDC